MNKQQQQDFFDAFTQKQMNMMLKKGDDYSNTDRLSNFKFAGQIAQITPAQNCFSLIATKVARLGQLLKPGATPNNESVSDSVLDLANYAMLLAMILVEEEPVPVSAANTFGDDERGLRYIPT